MYLDFSKINSIDYLYLACKKNCYLLPLKSSDRKRCNKKGINANKFWGGCEEELLPCLVVVVVVVILVDFPSLDSGVDSSRLMGWRPFWSCLAHCLAGFGPLTGSTCTHALPHSSLPSVLLGTLARDISFLPPQWCCWRERITLSRWPLTADIRLPNRQLFSGDRSYWLFTCVFM